MIQRFFHPHEPWHDIPELPEKDVDDLILMLCYIGICLIFPILNAFLFVD